MSARFVIVGATLFALLGTPTTSRAADSPTETRPNRALLFTGAAIVGSTYAVTASAAAANQRAADRDLFVPVAGPFMNLANRNCSGDCSTQTRDTALLLTSGGLQLAGAGLMIASAVFPEKREAGLGLTRRPHRERLWTGISLLSVTYLGSVIAGGAAGDRIEDKNLFIPIAGPWLDLGQRNCEFRRCDDQQEAIWKTLIVASGVLQGTGAVLAVSSFFTPQASVPGGDRPTAKPDVHVAPMSYAGGAGLGAVGQF